MKPELFNYKVWIDEANPKNLKSFFESTLESCEFEILGFMDHHFQPQGYTCIWLLGESHLAIHTYPEHNKSYIELTSCSSVKNLKFIELTAVTYPEKVITEI